MTLALRTKQFMGRRVAVIGAARTGRAVSAVLTRLGATVRLSDAKSPEELAEDYREASALAVEVLAGASPEAALEGVDLVVPSPGVRRNSPTLRLAMERSIPILSEVEIAYRIARCPILAVTGTNGKSTTVVWLARMLQTSGYRAHIAGNIATDTIQRTLIDAAEEAEEQDVIVAEVSSFQLEWVERFRPKIGVLTNIRRDHLAAHGGFEAYAACKARMFAAQRPDDIAILNAVNAPSRRVAANLRSRVVWFDRGHCESEEWASVRDQYLTVRLKGSEYRLVHVDELQLPGRHNVENALAASAAALAYGADPEAVAVELRAFDGLDHRMEIVAEHGGVTFINSSMTTNVDSAVRVLETVGRHIILIAGGAPKGEDFGPLGRAMARYVNHAILIGEAAPVIETAAFDADFHNVSRADSLEDAVRQAALRARPGDTVLLAPACASHDMFRDFQERGRVFRYAVAQLMAEESGGMADEP